MDSENQYKYRGNYRYNVQKRVWQEWNPIFREWMNILGYEAYKLTALYSSDEYSANDFSQED